MQHISKRYIAGDHVAIFASKNLMLKCARSADDEACATRWWREVHLNVYCERIGEGDPRAFREPLNFLK